MVQYSSICYQLITAATLLVSCASYCDTDSTNNALTNEVAADNGLGLNGKQVIYQDINGNLVTAEQFSQLIEQYQSSAKNSDKVLSLTKIMGDAPNKVIVKAELTERTTSEKPAINLAINEKMPNLNGTNLLGKQMTIDFAATDPKQQYTLISSYFLDCGACIKEVPAIKAFIKQYPQVVVRYVTFEPVEQSRKFASQFQINAEIVSNAENWLKQVGITAYPTVVLLNHAGEVMAAESGYSERDKLKFVEALLPTPAS